MKQTKYLGIYLEKQLTWNFKCNEIKRKWSRSCGLLAKLRYFVKTDLLRTMHFANFDSILRYAIRAPDDGGARGTMAPPLFLKLYFAEDVFLKICVGVILHDIQSLIGSGSPKILSGAWQYKFGISIEIEQIQEKAFRIRSFKPKTDPSNPLFQNLKTIFKEILSCNDCIFGHG